MILADELSKLGKTPGQQDRKTQEVVCDDYLKRYMERPDLSPETMKAKSYEESLAKKAFKGLVISDITGAQLAGWWSRFCREKRINGKERSARTKNTILECAKTVFRYAEGMGLIKQSPQADIRRFPLTKTFKRLSPRDEFRSVIREMRTGYKRKLNLQSDDFVCYSADMIEFMTYSGCRHGEARQVLRDDITPDGVIIHGVKLGGDRLVPFNSGLKEVCDRLIKYHKECRRAGNESIFQIVSPRKAFERATQAVNAPHRTLHGLRHFFITNCVESGILPATIAKWVSHKDGELLIAKTYTHLRDDHGKAEAAKLDF